MHMESDLFECILCNEAYNEKKHCPRLLPCSHTFCSDCIDQLITVKVDCNCPVCRLPFRANCKEDITVNRIVLDFLEVNAKANPLTIKSGQKNISSFEVWQEAFSKDLRDGSLAFCVQEKNNTEEIMNRKKELKALLEGGIDHIDKSLIPTLIEIRDSYKTSVEKIDKDYEFLETGFEKLSQEEKKLQGVDSEVKASQSFASADSFIATKEEIEGRLITLTKEMRSFLSDDEPQHYAMLKNFESTERQVKKIKDLLRKQQQQQQQQLQQQQRRESVEEERIPLMGAVSLQILPNGRQYITMYDIVRRDETMMKILVEGLLWVCREDQGRKWYSIIELDSRNSLHVHHLSNCRHPPFNARLIKYDDIMKLVNVSSRRTFLDLGIDGRSLGRVIISLTDAGHYPDNFFHLCLGDKGRSYANSEILGAWDKGGLSERIVAGDYERNDGNGGRAVINGVDWWEEYDKEIYKRPSQIAGSVTVMRWSQEEASQFVIYTRDNPKHPIFPCFGKVDEGLSVITNTISHHPGIGLGFVRIMHCGVVVPLPRSCPD